MRARRLLPALALAVSMTGLASCGHTHRRAVAPVTGATTTTTASTVPPTTVAPTTTTTRLVAPPVAPLTGQRVRAAAARRPAVVLKIDNLQAALPQTGPNQADVVYEEMVEGGLTRLAAVFQSEYPDRAGPVRSGRLTDEGIADDLDHPVLAYAGANAIFQPQLAAQPVSDIDDDTNPDLFVRDYNEEAPHNLYTDVGALAALDSRQHPPPPLWAFRRAGNRFAAAGATPAAAIAINFPDAAVGWTWNAADRLWLRNQNGSIDVDADGTQLSAANVVVQFVPYVTSAYVSGEGSGADGGPIPEGELVGSGTAWYLSGGRVAVGTWARSSLTATTVYSDRAGTPIRLEPGRTWVELPALGTAATVTP